MKQVWTKMRERWSELQVGLLPGLLFLALIVGTRLTGFLQQAEWSAFDLLLRLQPTEPPDDRIVLISIDEQDIQAVQQYPFTDQQLADLLTTIKQYQPRVIGLDLYRDFAVEPGQAALTQVFQTTPNLIAIEKVLPSPIPAPPNLPLSQVGISDAVLDPDGHQRRAFLGTRVPGSSDFRFSLSLLVAQLYLQQEEILLDNGVRDSAAMRFGRAELPRVYPNTGSYVRVDAPGGAVQSLIYFRRGPDAFRVLTMRDLLSGNVEAEWLRDRVVLIGVTSPSIQDYAAAAVPSIITPDSKLNYGLEVQAHAVSQIISAALDQRPLLRSWVDPVEYLWIITWGLVGIGLAAYGRSPLNILMCVALSSILIAGLSYGALTGGWWIPIVPTLAILWLNSAGLAAFYQYDRTIKAKIEAQRQVVALLEQTNVELEDRVNERTAELQQSTLELEQAKDAAEQASLAKSTFLASMSHELRTPLNSILGFCQILAKDATLSRFGQERLHLIYQSGEHLLGLINDILELSKLESGRYQLNEADFDLYHLRDTLQALFQQRTDQKKLTFTIEIAPQTPLSLIGDEQKLSQVLINFLSNALKFTHTGQIAVRIRPSYPHEIRAWHTDTDVIQGLPDSGKRAYLYFAVEDTGAGIAPEEISKLFIPFEQTQSGMQSGKGTGLGLSICEQFVVLMGGQIKVWSQVGRGSTFSFIIPLRCQSDCALVPVGMSGSECGRVGGQEAIAPTDALLSPEAIVQSLNEMTVEWRHDLQQASLLLNGRQVMALLDQLPDAHADVADYLRELAESYDYSTLTNLLTHQDSH